ncbi:MAG: hypothetical protein EOP24_38495 [Hyphomicrobiales bacterium]|nr:MAG: hypothetical protein EOP24_38495 [Hyphomicrobiales bacterium]
MLEAGSRLTVESAKREAADLRALLRFLYLDGTLETDVGGAMPPVASWRGARSPAMSAAEVDHLLAGCDCSIASGRWDRAILMLLARLGPRSGEVAALRLSDVDRRVGEVLVWGKGSRRDRLPLPFRRRSGPRRLSHRRAPGVQVSAVAVFTFCRLTSTPTRASRNAPSHEQPRTPHGGDRLLFE